MSRPLPHYYSPLSSSSAHCQSTITNRPCPFLGLRGQLAHRHEARFPPDSNGGAVSSSPLVRFTSLLCSAAQITEVELEDISRRCVRESACVLTDRNLCPFEVRFLPITHFTILYRAPNAKLDKICEQYCCSAFCLLKMPFNAPVWSSSVFGDFFPF